MESQGEGQHNTVTKFTALNNKKTRNILKCPYFSYKSMRSITQPAIFINTSILDQNRMVSDDEVWTKHYKMREPFKNKK